MFNSRQRSSRNQPKNPISDMEQFYLNQYFQTRTIDHTTGPNIPPEAYQSHSNFPPIERSSLHQLEQRLTRIEQYLGISTESGFNSIER